MRPVLVLLLHRLLPVLPEVEDALQLSALFVPLLLLQLLQLPFFWNDIPGVRQ